MSGRQPVMTSLLLLGLFGGCKTTEQGSKGASSEAGLSLSASSAPRASTSNCEETCAGTFASAKILGCVTSCDQWLGRTVTLAAGAPLYQGLAPAQRCSFTYEKRDSGQVQAGTFHQLFSFGFRLTDGLGDGDFLLAGSGMSPPGELLDFSKEGDHKVFGRDASGNAVTLTYLKDDPSAQHRPTFKLEEQDLAEQESKTLRLVLGPKVDPQKPFAAVSSASFRSVVRGTAKHEITCTP